MMWSFIFILGINSIFLLFLYFYHTLLHTPKQRNIKLQPQKNETVPQLKKALYCALESNRTSMKRSVMNSKNELNWINSLSDNYS